MHKRRISFDVISKFENYSIQKNNKSDYTLFKVYRLIVLLSTINKVLKSIIINKITEIAKKYCYFQSYKEVQKKKFETTLKMLIDKKTM